jgi:hypothetical protein
VPLLARPALPDLKSNLIATINFRLMPLEVDIDEIVRQVMAELRKSSTVSPAVNGDTNKPSTPTPANTKPQVSQLEISERVVTLATLEHRLTDIRHVVLRRGAVVTPSVRDVLRERGINVSYSSEKNATAAAVTIVLGVAELAEAGSKSVATTFVEALSREGASIERVAATGLASVTSELADHAARGGRATVLVTSHSEAAVCLANRVPGVRAVGGRDVDAVRRGMNEVAANLLAFDPAAAPTAFRRLIHEFRTGWPRRVPAVLDLHFPRV